MKKALAFILALAILMSVSAVAFTAADTAEDTDYSKKCDEALLGRIAQSQDGDLIKVWLWFTNIDKEEMERMIAEATGMTFMEYKERKFHGDKDEDPSWIDEYQSTRLRVIDEMYEVHNREILAKLEIAEENIVFCDTFTPSSIVEIDKNTIAAAVGLDDVTSISLYLTEDDAIVEPLPTEKTEDESIRAKFDDFMRAGRYSGEKTKASPYRELYTKYDENGDLEWVLVYALPYWVEGEGWSAAMHVFNHRINIVEETYYGFFEYGYGLYDAKEDAIVDVCTIKDYSLYDGLAEALDANVDGSLLGDLDGDDAITSIDATMLQRCTAGLADWPERDKVPGYDNTLQGVILYYSDFNLDGDRDIIDVTCIQRYLAKLPYPVALKQ